MTLPLISVLLPAFNDELFIESSLRSLSAQSVHEFEVIVSDDCSNDRTVEIAKQWASEDPRFRVFSNERNLGMTRNWNRALREATGEYVVKLDADDVMRPRCLEFLVAELREHSTMHSAYCRTLDCDEALEPFSSYLGDKAFYLSGLNPLERHLRSGHEWLQLCFSDIQLWHSNAQIHRRVDLVRMGGWDERFGCASDTDLILRVLETDRDVCHIPYAGVLYRHRPSSVSSRYRRSGLLKWESALVHLSSLTRYRTNGHRVGRPLTRAWWRFWQNWQALQQAGDLRSLEIPEQIRAGLLEAAGSIEPPPLMVRLEGEARRWLRRAAFLEWASPIPPDS